MLLWLHGTFRQWRRHRFVTGLLVLAYMLGVALSILVYSGVTTWASSERDHVMGDPTRLLEVHITNQNETVPLDVPGWVEGVAVNWGWVLIPKEGRALMPALSSLQSSHLIAFFGEGELSWQPPLRMGRFLSAAEIQAGTPVIVKGEELADVEAPGYAVVGVATDKIGLGRGWGHDLFVPLNSLPLSVRQAGASALTLHIELKQPDLLQAIHRLESNIRSLLPTAHVQIDMVQDYLLNTKQQVRNAYWRGLGLVGILLAFVALNTGTLSLHWITLRRRELAVRLALGASMGSIVGMVLFEHLLIGITGLALAIPLVGLVLHVSQQIIPLSVSWDTALVAVCVTLGTGILSCLIPLRTLFRTPIRSSLVFRD